MNKFGGTTTIGTTKSADQEIMQQTQKGTVAAEEPEAEASDNSDQLADKKGKQEGVAGPAQATGSAGVSSSLTRELLEHMSTVRNATRSERVAVDNILDIETRVRAQLEMPLQQRDEGRTQDALHDVLRTISNWWQATGKPQEQDELLGGMAIDRRTDGPIDMSLSSTLGMWMSVHVRAQRSRKEHADWIKKTEAQLRAELKKPEQQQNREQSHDILETITEWRDAMRLGLLPEQEMILNDAEHRWGLSA